jgi:hypothetical protein
MCSSLSPDITLVCDAEFTTGLSSVVDGGALNATTRGFVSEVEVFSNRSSVDVSCTEGTGSESALDASGCLEIAGVEGSVGVELEGGVGGGVGVGDGVGVGSDAIAGLDIALGAVLGIGAGVGEGSGVRSDTGLVGGLRSAGGSGKSYVTCKFEIVSSPGASLKKMSGTGN